MLNVDDDSIMEDDGKVKISYKAGSVWNLEKDRQASDSDKAEVNTIGSDFAYDQRIENAYGNKTDPSITADPSMS